MTGVQTCALPICIAPSRLEESNTRRINDLLRSGETEALRKGTLIHAWLQQIRWLESPLPAENTLREIAAEHGSSESELTAALQQFQSMLATPLLRDLLSEARYRQNELATHASWLSPARPDHDWRLEVKNERAFSVMREGGMLAGSVDRLILVYDGERLVAADILDYKTDALPANDPAELQCAVERYRPQQMAYREAIAAIYQLPSPRIRTRLAFLAPGQLVTV